MEVVFTLLAERYERGSVLMTATCRSQNGKRSCKDAMMRRQRSTGCCIIRAHRAEHPELPVEHAKQRQQAETRPRVREADRREATAQTGKGRAVEMPGLWKAWKAKKQASPLSTSPLEIRQKGGAISTFHQPGPRADGKVENSKAGFPLSHRPDVYGDQVEKRAAGGLCPPPAAGAPAPPKS